MKFTLIVCTYKRRKALQNLLDSVRLQSLYPNEILIIDGSPDDETNFFLKENPYKNLKYYKVTPEQRGLTKQRNFGITHINKTSEVVCFLDDDTVLKESYFENIIQTFLSDINISGVGGIAVNENRWENKDTLEYNRNKFYEFEGYIYKESSRNVLRNVLRLQSNLGPGRMPDFSHGRTCGFPLTNKVYDVDLLIGMSMSFRRIVFENINFSTYFEGYGLYEDADYSIRALKYGKNVINTAAQLEHHHDAAGRPNKYQYGKMVVRNGWYVWRVKNPNPKLIDRLRWNTIILLLLIVRAMNVFNTKERKEAFTETIGRLVGFFTLLINKPKINY
jgi:GT2 family glycosyltransferase